MEQFKDIVYVAVIGGGALIAIVRSIMRMRDKIKTHNDVLAEHDIRIGELESQRCITDHKLDILHANMVRLLEKFKIEPVQDLFDTRSIYHEKKTKNRDS